MADLDELTIGLVFDMLIEAGNDTAQDAYHELATQEDMDKF